MSRSKIRILLCIAIVYFILKLIFLLTSGYALYATTTLVTIGFLIWLYVLDHQEGKTKVENKELPVASFCFGIISVLYFFSASKGDASGIIGGFAGIIVGVFAIIFSNKSKKLKIQSKLSPFGFVMGILGIVISSLMFIGCISNRLYVSSIGSNHHITEEEHEENLKNTYLELLEIQRTYCENNYKDISYSDLSRNPDNYKSECIHFKGEVIQVLEDRDTNQAQLRVNTKLSDYSYIENSYIDDTIYVYIYDYDFNNRILEDDIIDLYGTSEGILTYKSVMGASVSIPSMTALKYSIQ